MFVPDEGYTRHMSYTQTYKIPMFLLDLVTKSSYPLDFLVYLMKVIPDTCHTHKLRYLCFY